MRTTRIDDAIIVENYLTFKDNRGKIYGLLNDGLWGEVNYVFSNKGVVRGNHYHKKVTEIIFLLSGQMSVELHDVRNPEYKKTFFLEECQGIKIVPYLYHTITYKTDCTHLSVLDEPFVDGKPDIWKETFLK